VLLSIMGTPTIPGESPRAPSTNPTILTRFNAPVVQKVYRTCNVCGPAHYRPKGRLHGFDGTYSRAANRKRMKSLHKSRRASEILAIRR
jgi:hypothetical protein